MRYWNRATDPDARATRSRSTVRGVSDSVFGQRPMFSRPDEENEPELGWIAPEARLDDLVPTDESEGSQARAELLKAEASTPVMLTFATDNVTATPTDAELTLAFGDRPVGFTAFVIDGGGAGVVYFVIKSQGDTWYFEQLTKAV